MFWRWNLKQRKLGHRFEKFQHCWIWEEEGWETRKKRTSGDAIDCSMGSDECWNGNTSSCCSVLCSGFDCYEDRFVPCFFLCVCVGLDFGLLFSHVAFLEKGFFIQCKKKKTWKRHKFYDEKYILPNSLIFIYFFAFNFSLLENWRNFKR